jgi:hypothetical protein
MKNLVLGSLIAIAASGCIIESNDDTYITASWNIKQYSNNTLLTCPPGFTTAALYSQPANSDGTLVGSPTIDLFDCAANIGTSGPLAPGLYLSWIEIANDNNTSVYAKSLSTPIDTSPGDQAVGFDIFADAGYFQLQWNLIGASSNAPLSCAGAGAGGGVELTATLSGSSAAASDQFDCENQYGVTDPYLSGTYTVSVAALDATDRSIGTAPTIPSAVIGNANAVTNLGTINIPIDGK